MTLVFFIYGLSFFLLGFSILLYPKQDSAFPLARRLGMIAVFGLLHGINEWLDLFLLIGAESLAGVIAAARMATLPLSFLALLAFGCVAIPETTGRARWLKRAPFLLAAAWLAIFALSDRHLLMGDIWARYLLGAPGAALTGCGLLLYVPSMRRPAVARALWHVRLAGLTFLLYGGLAGLIVKDAGFFPSSTLSYDAFMAAFGFPVQIARAACASLLTVAMIGVLSVFQWESRGALRESELRFRTIAETAPIILFTEDTDGRITFAAGKGLAGLGLQDADLIGAPVTTLFGAEAALVDDAPTPAPAISVVETRQRVFELWRSPGTTAAASTAGAIGVALDITQRIRDQQELEQQRQALLQAQRMAEVGLLSENMTRELDEPLTLARLLADRILADIPRTAGHEPLRRAAQKAQAELVHAGAVLERFKQSAQLDADHQPRAVDLYALVRRILAVLGGDLRRVGLTVSVRDIEIFPRLHVTERELEQLFFVVIQKTIETAAAHPTDRLVIAAHAADACLALRFAVCPAPPMPAGGAPALAAFFPVAAASSTAMDLAIIEWLVSTHQGDLRIETDAEAATLQVSLPVVGVSD